MNGEKFLVKKMFFEVCIEMKLFGKCGHVIKDVYKEKFDDREYTLLIDCKDCWYNPKYGDEEE